MGTQTIHIVHGTSITQDYLLGADPQLPPCGNPLTIESVRRAVMSLIGYEVLKFDDGHYHGEIHTWGLYDLLNTGAPGKKMETKPDASKIGIYIVAGVRWDCQTRYRIARIFGPQSDPRNIITLDLTENL